MLMPTIADSEIGVSRHRVFAKLFGNALRDAERAAVRTDILAKDEHFRIAAHLLDKRFANGLEIADLTHRGL